MILAFHVSDIIRIPFGYLLDYLYQFTNNYGIALILFSLLVKLILMPVSAMSKKNMMAMSRLSPLAQAIQNKYPNDQARASQEMQKLYKEEGVSMWGSCLWSFIPILILFPLYHVIREPITYMLHFSPEEAASIVEAMKSIIPDSFTTNTFYDQLTAAAHMTEYAPQLLEALPQFAGRSLEGLNFSFLGINLGLIPNWRFWAWGAVTWPLLGGILIPVLSALSNIVGMKLSMKLNATVATDENGDIDKAAVQKTNSANSMMMWMMPVMTLWIGFTYPCSLSLYWLSQGIFGMVQDAFLTVHYRKVYANEDSIKRRVAAEKAAAEAEKERIRAQHRAENPDGITANTSKKKLQNKQVVEREQAQAAANRAAAEAAGANSENLPLSGDPQRPFCKGRAYQPDRYSKHTGKNEE